MREAPRGVTPEPSRVQDRWSCSSERFRAPPSGDAIDLVLRDRIGSVAAEPAPRGGIGRRFRVARSARSFGIGSVRCRRDAPVRRTRPSGTTVLGRNRGPGSGGEPQESCRRPRGRRRTDRSSKPWSAGRPLSPREDAGSAGGPDPGSRVRGGRRNALERRGKTQESIGPRRLRPPKGTDLRGEQDLEAAGHRDLLVLRAVERDVKNSRKGTGAGRRTAPRRGKTLQGEPHEWHRPSWPEGAGGRKPSGG